jgi:hypothetical protein
VDPQRRAPHLEEGRQLNAEAKSERLKTLTARKKWCDDAVVSLERDMARTPWMMLGNLLAVPVGLLWHISVALLVVTVVTGFAFTIWYVAWVHHHECKVEIEILEAELEKLAA